MGKFFVVGCPRSVRRSWKARAFQRISPERVGLWRRELNPDQLGLLERWGGWALRELGYELATDGKARLPWWFQSETPSTEPSCQTQAVGTNG